MTAYPVNFQYDTSAGAMFDGMAETEAEARVIESAIRTEANGEPTEAPAAFLTTREAGPLGSRDQICEWWADEIAAGYVTPIQVWGGYVAQVEFWTFE